MPYLHVTLRPPDPTVVAKLACNRKTVLVVKTRREGGGTGLDWDRPRLGPIHARTLLNMDTSDGTEQMYLPSKDTCMVAYAVVLCNILSWRVAGIA
jgi:hypothetical protein